MFTRAWPLAILPLIAITTGLLFQTATSSTSEARSIAASPSPVLIGPEDGSTLASFDPTLIWMPPADTTQYHLQVVPFNDDGPGIDLHIGTVESSFQIPPPPQWYGLLPDITYTWRIRVSDAPTFVGLTDPSWSAWAERRFRTPAVTSSTLASASPGGETTVANLTPVIEWTDSRSDLFYYEVQLSKDPTFTTDPAGATAMVYWELRHGGVTSPPNSYAVPSQFPLEPNTRYYWRVRHRVQGDGSPVAWTTAFTFWAPATTPVFTPTPSPAATPTSTPTAAATSTLTPTAATTPTRTPTAAATPTRTPTPGSVMGELIKNGDFESSGSWINDCNCVGSAAVAGGWHSGQKGAYIVPTSGSKAANVYQILSLPASAGSITWSYWFKLLGTGSGDADCFVAGILEGSNVLTSTERCVSQGYHSSWTKHTIDLTPYKGKTIIVLFGMTTQFSQKHDNYALVDDVSMMAQ